MKKYISIILINLLVLQVVFAGNEQRAGQAGASELLLNPWATSSGLGNSNIASVSGLESVFINVAGSAFTNKTELAFVNTDWFSGSDISIIAFGVSQKISETGVLSLSVNSLDFSEIPVTTADFPEGDIGTYHPQNTTIGISYANAFSNSIYGGATVKIINEANPDLSASGLAIDLGIMYVTGIGLDANNEKKENNFRFGITLKNVGPTMMFKGDGLSMRAETENGVEMTIEQRSADFELPSLLAMGVTYDIPIVTKNDSATKNISVDHLLRLSAAFTSNSFTKDQFQFGVEYNVRDILILRGGYTYENGIEKFESRVVALTGPSFGASVQIPIGSDKQVMSLDYTYRATENFSGCHSIGARISL